MRLLGAASRFSASLAGRLAIILTIGMSVAAISSLLVAERVRQRDFERFRAERVALSAADVLRRLDTAPRPTRAALDTGGIVGAHAYRGKRRLQQSSDAVLDAALNRRLPPGREATGALGSFEDCFGPLTTELRNKFSQRVAGFLPILPECWLVTARSPEGGTFITIGFDMPSLRMARSAALNPVYLILIVIAAAILSVLVSRFALKSLGRLTAAAQAFSNDIDAEPIDETGPADVREAFVAFNIMQKRVREGVRERTQILAAISHDLQTPLTRMRLRLEKIEDVALRERLIEDLGTTLRLVREGLALARSSESADEWTVLDLDSLLESLVDDAVLDGLEVSAHGCGAMIRTKPDALARVLQNLVDNAVRYGGSAEISAAFSRTGLDIAIRDHGPGIPEAEMHRMFDPFVRGETSRSRETGGTGIGLTIARAQANTFGGRIELANAPDGGLIATLGLPKSAIVRRSSSDQLQ